MKIDVTLTGTEQVRRELRRLGSLGPRALAATAEDVEDYVEGQGARHHKTGRLVRCSCTKASPGGWEIGHDLQHAPHALFVHWGARPHVIRPKNKKALRWPAGGKFAFAREVHHPGYKGDAWMARAAALAPRIFEQHVRALLARTGA